MKKIKELAAEYGSWAVGIYLSIFALVISGFAIAIKLGFDPEGTTGNLGTLGAAWLATKATQPLRIAATVALTPLLAKLFGRKAASEEATPTEG